MPAPLHPPPYAISPAALDAQTRLEYFVAGGPGGQHRNKTETGVRLHHAPSGIIVQTPSVQFHRLMTHLLVMLPLSCCPTTSSSEFSNRASTTW